MRKTKILWKAQSKGGKWTRSHGPSYWNGGTCLTGGVVLIYSEVPDALSVCGEAVMFFCRYRQEYYFFCPLCEVEAIFNQDGEQIYPKSG